MLYVRELVHDDFDRRIEFYELIEACGNDFVNNIVFSDEASFKLHGNVNRRYWSIENSHWMKDNKSQYPDKVNIWTGNWRSFNLGLFFIDENLKSKMYETMLIE